MTTERALEQRTDVDGRLYSPSSARNRGPIGDAFQDVGLTKGRVLEIGSGTGEHAVEMLTRFAGLTWVASDVDEAARNSCRAWRTYSGLEERLSVEEIDLITDRPFAAGDLFDIVYCANVIHISPFTVAENLFELAGSNLKAGGHLVLYGPYRRDGVFLADSNAQFDKSLKTRNPEWGVRDLEQDLLRLAEKAGMALRFVRAMPSNNDFVVFSR